MNAWYFLTIPAWLILSVTATARLADIGRHQWALRDHVRRFGLMGVGVAALVMATAPVTSQWWLLPGHTWKVFILAWSIACVWMTTPSQPPWWDFILGVHRQTDLWRKLGLRARILGELRALRASFRATSHRAPAGQRRPAR